MLLEVMVTGTRFPDQAPSVPPERTRFRCSQRRKDAAWQRRSNSATITVAGGPLSPVIGTWRMMSPAIEIDLLVRELQTDMALGNFGQRGGDLLE
jgi:hypothetical protein